ncbi:MAG: energy-coupling factor ABC transporter ATP-binding protein [Lachnospiraceae bacterium]|nr:energy-coupling factor ABC transporter ATP-binding protein [Lachnospiraceae bacterium]
MIELKNVSFNYGEETKQNGILNIDLKILKGEFIVITGGSGCGKTTITRLINGLIPNYYEGKLSGTVIIEGNEVTKAPIYDTAKKVSSVFQNPKSQFFNVDTTSELAFAPENQGITVEEIKRRIYSTVEDFKIHALMDRSIFKLSGGEKQKIACASVSVAGTEIVVLDEPSSNLDADAIEDLKKVLQIWKDKGKTIIIAEHRLYFLRELADRMIIMKDGKITEEICGDKIRLMSIRETREKGLRPLCIEELTYTNDMKRYHNDNIKLSDFYFIYRDGQHGIHIGDLTIKENAIVAVIGHNGAGKSTFARCLCGLERNCKGILLDGEQKFRNKERIKNCYMVMQDVNHQLFTESVLDEVILSMSHKKTMSEEDKRKAAGEILRSMDLAQYEDVHPMALSGGQKQRVAIASAIASDRKIIIFDEPTSGLDYAHMNQVADNLKKLSKMEKTVFVITHDSELILNCCTDVLHLESGKVIETYELNKDSEEKLKQFFIEETVNMHTA